MLRRSGSRAAAQAAAAAPQRAGGAAVRLWASHRSAPEAAAPAAPPRGAPAAAPAPAAPASEPGRKPPPLSLAACVYGESTAEPQGHWANVDGQRVEDGRYAAFCASVVRAGIPAQRVITDTTRLYAFSTDASFYRLIPKVVVRVHSEDEVRRCLAAARAHGTPVTFRAAGTSLSGQAVTDSVLLKLSHNARHWRQYEVHERAERITVEPGLIGGEVNRILMKYTRARGLPQRKIGPDPASIDSCMIGGIVSNNSSGMCCGVKQNTYHTMQDLRAVFWDGSVLDTADPESRAAFSAANAELLQGLSDLAAEVQADAELVATVKRKFSIKNTTGYSINALVDFPPSEPIEILKRLLVGSEGTLGFVSRVTYHTVPDHPHKEAAFFMFPDMASACNATAALRINTTVDAVELFDYASLKQGQTNAEFVSLVKGCRDCPVGAAGLLVEVRGEDPAALRRNVEHVLKVLADSGVSFLCHGDAVDITSNKFLKPAKDQAVLWDMRKGLIPKVGGARPAGTTMLIEDVACPIENLAQMNLDLTDMFERHGYGDACIFGHALEGNMHLVFSQCFRTGADVEQYSNMMDDMADIVARKHKGSLKGEHGTGRNVAPFVELEWGAKAYEIMWRVKELFDPRGLLNPSVLVNRDEDCHRKALKPMPIVDPLVDRCIECGFCESNCPSRDATLTPRQRISVMREISRLQAKGAAARPAEKQRLKTMVAASAYLVEETCAADGMCQEKCPVSINTGELVKQLRRRAVEAPAAPEWQRRAAGAAQRHFAAALAGGRMLLRGAAAARALLGDRGMQALSAAGRALLGNRLPVWTPWLPSAAPPLPAPHSGSASLLRVVYMPSCVCRTFGPSKGDETGRTAPQALMSVLRKAGYTVIYPEGVESLCCGMAFNSRGFAADAGRAAAATEAALLRASDGGRIPILCETSPCVMSLRGAVKDPRLHGRIFEPLEFVHDHVAQRLDWKKVRQTVAVHVPCSSKKMKLQPHFDALVAKCAEEVVDSSVPCCGMAGDRGMRYPELTAASLAHLEHGGCSEGFSTSRTCEMGLSLHSGLQWRSLVQLVDEATTPRAPSFSVRYS